MRWLVRGCIAVTVCGAAAAVAVLAARSEDPAATLEHVPRLAGYSLPEDAEQRVQEALGSEGAAEDIKCRVVTVAAVRAAQARVSARAPVVFYDWDAWRDPRNQSHLVTVCDAKLRNRGAPLRPRRVVLDAPGGPVAWIWGGPSTAEPIN